MEILETLNKLDIQFELFEHGPFRTCDDSRSFYEGREGGDSKNLFIRDKNYRLVKTSQSNLLRKEVRKPSPTPNRQKIKTRKDRPFAGLFVYPTNPRSNCPTKYETMAAMLPIAEVSNPDRIQCLDEKRVLTVPTMKRATMVPNIVAMNA